MNTTLWLGRNSQCYRACLLHWPRTVNTKVRDDGKIFFGKLSWNIMRAVKQQVGRSMFETVVLPQLGPEESSIYMLRGYEVESGVLQSQVFLWKRAPNLNTFLWHGKVQADRLVNPGSQGVRLQGSSLWKHALWLRDRCRLSHTNVGAHLKPLTRPWESYELNPTCTFVPASLASILSLKTQTHRACIKGQMHFHYVFTLTDTVKFNRARHVSMKHKQSELHETSYETSSQLTQWIRKNNVTL